MDPKVNYTAVGVYVVVLTVALTGIIYWLSAEHHRLYKTYLIYMKEAVNGLTLQAPVKFNGVDVGYVDKIGLDPQDPQEVRLVIKVDKDVPITQSTVAVLIAQGITGVTNVGLKARTPNAPPLKKLPTEPYPVIPSEPSLLVQLNAALREVTDSFKNISETVNKVFDKESRDAFKQALTNISRTTEQLPGALKQLPGTLKSISSAAEGISSTSVEVKATLKNSDTILQNLSQQTLPQIYQAAASLKETLDNLKEVTAQMKQNPAVIIRGSTPPPPGPGE